MTAIATELGQNLLSLIRADEVVRQNALYGLNTFFNYFIIVGATILAQQELQNIDRHIGSFFDFLGQVFADDFTIKGLAQLFFYYITSAFTHHRLFH